MKIALSAIFIALGTAAVSLPALAACESCAVDSVIRAPEATYSVSGDARTRRNNRTAQSAGINAAGSTESTMLFSDNSSLVYGTYVPHRTLGRIHVVSMDYNQRTPIMKSVEIDACVLAQRMTKSNGITPSDASLVPFCIAGTPAFSNIQPSAFLAAVAAVMRLNRAQNSFVSVWTYEGAAAQASSNDGWAMSNANVGSNDALKPTWYTSQDRAMGNEYSAALRPALTSAVRPELRDPPIVFVPYKDQSLTQLGAIQAGQVSVNSASGTRNTALAIGNIVAGYALASGASQSVGSSGDRYKAGANNNLLATSNMSNTITQSMVNQALSQQAFATTTRTAVTSSGMADLPTVAGLPQIGQAAKAGSDTRGATFQEGTRWSETDARVRAGAPN